MSTPPLRTRYAPSGPVDLRLTLSTLQRGTHDPAFRWDGPDAWRTLRTPLGAATLRLRAGDGIEALAWGPGAEWAIASVPGMLGADDEGWVGLDLSSVPWLAEVRRRLPGMRLSRTGLVMEALLPAVLEQKVTNIEARRAWRYLLAKYGEEPPGPAPLGMRVAPTAEVWRRVPSWEWHRAGVGPQRSQTMVRCASLADSIERAAGVDAAEAERRLRSLPGIGVWTAAETLQRSHAAADAVSVGDYHLPATVGWALAGRPVDDDGMLELLSPWAGHRQRVMRLILASGFRKPAFGPRMTVQDHRWH